MKHLTFEDRQKIEAGLKKLLSLTKIAREMGKPPSTICREVQIHSFAGTYTAVKAMEIVQENKVIARKRLSEATRGKPRKRAPTDPSKLTLRTQVKNLTKDVQTLKEAMATNNRITLNERYVIARLLDEGKSCAAIAKLIGRGKNTIVVEVKRAGGKAHYNPDKAQAESDIRHAARGDTVKVKLKEYARTEGYFNPYIALKERIETLEMQIEILTTTVKEKLNELKN